MLLLIPVVLTAVSFASAKPDLQVKLPSKQAGTADTGVDARASTRFLGEGLQRSFAIAFEASNPALA